MNDIKLGGFAADGASSNRNASYNMLFVDKNSSFNDVFIGTSY